MYGGGGEGGRGREGGREGGGGRGGGGRERGISMHAYTTNTHTTHLFPEFSIDKVTFEVLFVLKFLDGNG